jgi:hypothetical protein
VSHLVWAEHTPYVELVVDRSGLHASEGLKLGASQVAAGDQGAVQRWVYKQGACELTLEILKASFQTTIFHLHV